MANVQHIYKQAGPPTNPPPGEGHHWVDTVSGNTYLSKGVSSVSDWQLVGSGGLPNGGTLGQTLIKNSGIDGDASWSNIPGITGAFNQIAYYDGVGNLADASGWSFNSFFGLNGSVEINPNNGGGNTLNSYNFQFNPIVNSPNESWSVFFYNVAIDQPGDGYTFGTSGNAIQLHNNQITHADKSNTGALTMITNNFQIGNGTDPITVNGAAYCFGFGAFYSGVTINGPIQGYTFQPTIQSGAIMDPTNSYATAYGDFTQYSVNSSFHQSFAASPTFTNIPSNKNYTGLNVNPQVQDVLNNGGVSCVSVGGTYNDFFGNSYWHGVNVNPNINQSRYAAGLNVTMDNVTPYPGLVSSLVFQDLTLTFNSPADNNGYSLEYTTGGTAGSEVVSILGQAITVQIDSGVSTAAQVKAALDATTGFNSAVTVTISGVGSNPQVAAGPTNFSGGENAGNVLAAYLDGDVQITGNLQFGGALSIGKLSAFHTQAMVNGGGTPTSIHSLISSPTVAASTTVSLADTIGVNTAMLLTIGDNATVTSAFLGATALALPAVVNMGTGSTIDVVSGAGFAVSLDAAATGGTIGRLPLCRALALPNGVTTINNLIGFQCDLPFGDPGTNSYGFYERDFKGNYLQSNLLIGGTPGSDDLVTNASVAFEIKSTTKSLVLSRMTTTQRDAMTAINGMIIYNTSTDKFQGYAAGSWVDLH